MEGKKGPGLGQFMFCVCEVGVRQLLLPFLFCFLFFIIKSLFFSCLLLTVSMNLATKI